MTSNKTEEGTDLIVFVDKEWVEFVPVWNPSEMMYCTSLAWSFDGTTLFNGNTDGTIRVWKVTQQSIGNDV